MRRTDKTISLPANQITITLDQSSEVRRWNECQSDINLKMVLIEEFAEIKCSTNNNTVFEIKPDLFLIVSNSNGSFYQLLVNLCN